MLRALASILRRRGSAVAALLSVLSALVLSWAHYRRFWAFQNDEATFYYNLVRFDGLAVFTEMFWYGVFSNRPVVFLYDILMNAWGQCYWVLRFPALLMAVLVAILWGGIIWEALSAESPFLRVAAVAATFIAPYFVYYSAQIKPYMFDFWVVGAAFWAYKRFFFNCFISSRRKWAFFCFLWTVPVLLSYTYVIAIFSMTVAAFLFKARLRERHSWPRVAVLALWPVPWIVMSWWFDMRWMMGNRFLYGFWDATFIWGPTPWEWLVSFWHAMGRLWAGWWGLERGVAEPMAFLRLPLVVLAVAGVAGVTADVRAARERVPGAAVGAVLSVTLFIFGATGIYPVPGGRLDFFSVGFMVLLMARGALFMGDTLLGRRFVHLVSMAALLGIFGFQWPALHEAFAVRIPYYDFRSEIRQVAPPATVYYGEGDFVLIQAALETPPGLRFVLLSKERLSRPFWRRLVEREGGYFLKLNGQEPEFMAFFDNPRSEPVVEGRLVRWNGRM